MHKIIFLLAFCLTYISCNRPFCDPPFYDANSTFFDGAKWNFTKHVDNNRFPQADDSLSLYYSSLETRKSMLCDIVTRKIKKTDTFEKVVDILGDGCGDRKLYNHRTLSINNQSIEPSGEKKLIYRSGYNASGDCYLIIAFEENKVKSFFYKEAN